SLHDALPICVPRQPRKRRSLELVKTETIVKDRPVIEAKNLGISFKLSSGDFWALDGLDFTINEGEVVGIIGHNGAGKSTLCKVMTEILRPDKGSINIYGKTSSLLGYGTGFNPQLSGTDNIYLNAMLLGIPKRVVEKSMKKSLNSREFDMQLTSRESHIQVECVRGSGLVLQRFYNRIFSLLMKPFPLGIYHSDKRRQHEFKK